MATPSILSRINATANAAVAQDEINFNEATTGGSKMLPEGKALARLVQYIETGPSLSKSYPDKPPVNKFFLQFAVWGKAKNGETYHEMVDGKMVPGRVRTQFISVKKDLNSKSGAYKLFKRMNPEKSAQHFAQLLNGTFILPIVHNTVGEGENKKVYANIDLENIMQAVNPVTDEPIPVPEIEDESLFKLFLWGHPTKEDWDSLYIEGKSDEGKSKNWIQDALLASPEFPGSPLDALLNGGVQAGSAVAELPTLEEEVKEVKQTTTELPTTSGAEPDVTGEADFGLPTL